ncbi:MAG TPA: Ig-like domain-containing protein [Pseudonocardiaceae bacterium]
MTVAAVVLAACSATPGATGTANTGGGAAAQQAASVKPVSIDIQPAAGQVMNPANPVVVKATNGTLSDVTVTNTVKGTVVTGDYSADKSTWTSNEHLGYGSTYAVNATGAGGDHKAVTQKATLTTVTATKTSFPSLIPAPTFVQNTGVGVGQPITVQFDHAVTNKKAVQAALTVTTVPSQPGAWYWISSEQLDYRAQTYWQAGTTITLTASVYGVDLGGGVYGSTDRTATYKVHDALIAKADGNTEKMQIFDNGTLINTLPISMGKTSTPTHNGPHVISEKAQSVQMNSCTYGVCPPDPRAYNETEYWDERISNSGEYVHENPATVGAQGAVNVSHGCINLSLASAQWFFGKFGIGDVVEVTNSGGPILPIWDRYGDWEIPWSTWQAGNA